MKNIVVGIDFSNSSLNALKHAVAISLKTQGKLHLVWVKTPSTTNKAAKEELKQITQKAQTSLAELIADCKKEAPKSSVNSIILEGKAPIELTKYAANLQDPIIIIGTHGMSGDDTFAGSNAMKTVGMSSVPILILRENVKINRDLVQILAPIDTSFETLQKMKYVVAIAKAFAAKVLVLGLNAPPIPEVKHTVKVQLKHAGKMCDDAIVRHAAATIDIKGNVAQAVIEFAKNQDVNLIAVMREEEDDFSNFWMGSATRQLVNNTPMPLLVLPNVTYFSVSK